jgi:hypothetical protein
MGMIPHSSGRAGRGRLGDLLRAKGLVTEQQLAEAIACAHRRGLRLGSALVELGHADVDQISDALARQHGVLACRDDDLRVIATPVAQTVPAAVARKHCVVPVRIIGGHTMLVAMRDPHDEDAITDLWRRTGLSIRPVVAAEDALRQALDHLYGPPGDTPPEIPPVPETPTLRPLMRPRAMPQGSIAPPFREPAPPAPAPRSRWPYLAAGGAALVAAAATVVLLRGGVDAEPVPPTVVLDAVGVRAEVGPGWHRVRDTSRPVYRLGARMTSDVLVRGDGDEPTEILALARSPRVEASIERWTAELVDGGLPLRSWWGCPGNLRACFSRLECKPDDAVHVHGVACEAQAIHGGTRYPVRAWLWPLTDGGVVVLAWASRGGAAAPDHAQAIARSVEPL